MLSGAPSTIWAVVTDDEPFAATLAAGSLLLPEETRRGRLLCAATVAHVALSAGWTIALSRLPRRTVALGTLAGLGIAALDLGVAHTSRSPRLAAIRALPVAPQVADHVAFGALVGGVLGRSRD